MWSEHSMLDARGYLCVISGGDDDEEYPEYVWSWRMVVVAVENEDD